MFTNLRDDWRAASDPQPFRTDSTSYNPDQWVIHYGGGGPYRQANWAEVKSLLNAWRNWHMNGPSNMRDIAYNYAAPPQDGSTYSVRLRGENPNGAHTNSAYLGSRTRTFVFYTGNNSIPATNQLEAFARLWEQDPMPVTMHGRLPWQDTDCAGTWLGEWIDREGWFDYLGDPVSRYAGSNRYDTGRLVAVDNFTPPVPRVLIVSGESQVDAVFAASLGEPVLAAHFDSIPAETINALQILQPATIKIVGGEAVVSRKVATQLKQYEV